MTFRDTTNTGLAFLLGAAATWYVTRPDTVAEVVKVGEVTDVKTKESSSEKRSIENPNSFKTLDELESKLRELERRMDKKEENVPGVHEENPAKTNPPLVCKKESKEGMCDYDGENPFAMNEKKVEVRPNLIKGMCDYDGPEPAKVNRKIDVTTILGYEAPELPKLKMEAEPAVPEEPKYAREKEIVRLPQENKLPEIVLPKIDLLEKPEVVKKEPTFYEKLMQHVEDEKPQALFSYEGRSAYVSGERIMMQKPDGIYYQVSKGDTLEMFSKPAKVEEVKVADNLEDITEKTETKDVFMTVYGDTRTCPPCRALHNWLETREASNISPHVNFIDRSVDMDNFSNGYDGQGIPYIKFSDGTTARGFSGRVKRQIISKARSNYNF